MSAVNLSLAITGAPDAEDKLWLGWLVGIGNDRRAAADPPETPLPASTNTELRNSAEIVMIPTIQAAVQSYIQQAVEDTRNITRDDWQQIRKNIKLRLDNGESVASIIADTAS